MVLALRVRRFGFAALFFCGICAPAVGQLPTFEWAYRAGHTSFDFGSTVATDSLGNVYIAGEFSGEVAFPVPNSANPTVLTSVGARDGFVAKLNSFGNWLWVVQIESEGGQFDDFVDGIAVDGAGNVYITGTFALTATFDLIEITSVGNQDAFIAKLDTNGDWQWAVRCGGPLTDAGCGIAVDAVGGVYVTGQFFSLEDIDTDFGDTVLEAVGEGDLFVARLDTNGNWLWARRAGGFNSFGPLHDNLRYDAGFGIAVDDLGGIYVTGKFFGFADFGPFIRISATTLDPTGDFEIFTEDAFVAKLDPDGDWLWVTQAGGAGADVGLGVGVDSLGQSYVTGYFQHRCTFSSPVFLDAVGIDDTFVAKLDEDGVWLWQTRGGGDAPGTLRDAGYGIAVDAVGDVYLTGYFTGEADFGTTLLDSGLNADVWMGKVDTDGAWQWARRVGGVYEDYGFGISLDGIGVMHAVGAMQGVASFETGLSLSSEGLFDAYVARLAEPISVIAASVRDGFALLDENGNGSLTRAESGLGIRSFLALDSNGDNRISLTELLAASVGPVGVADPVHVDFGFVGTEMGTDAQPFDTLLEGATFVAPGGTVMIAPGQSAGGLTIFGPMTLKRNGTTGSVRIGAN